MRENDRKSTGRDVLDKLEKISEKARKSGDPGPRPKTDITGSTEFSRAQENEWENRSKLYAKLALELITVVYVETENGEDRTYYFPEILK